MPCRLNRLWLPTWLEVRAVSVRSQQFPSVSIQVRDCGALRLKTVRVFLEMDAQMASQSDLNWFKSSQKRSLKTTFAQGLQKGPIPTPLNLENRAPVQAPALFSLSQPCPKRCPKSSQKRSQGTLKSTRNSNKTVFNKEPQIDTDSLWCFWSPKKPEWSPRLPKKAPKQAKKGSKVRSRTDSTKRFPQDLPKDPFWSVFGCVSVLFLLDFEFVL